MFLQHCNNLLYFQNVRISWRCCRENHDSASSPQTCSKQVGFLFIQTHAPSHFTSLHFLEKKTVLEANKLEPRSGPTYDFCAFHVLVQIIIFTFCPIKLKLTSIIRRFYTNSGAKFHSNPTTSKEFPLDPHCKNWPLSAT